MTHPTPPASQLRIAPATTEQALEMSRLASLATGREIAVDTVLRRDLHDDCLCLVASFPKLIMGYITLVPFGTQSYRLGNLVLRNPEDAYVSQALLSVLPRYLPDLTLRLPRTLYQQLSLTYKKVSETDNMIDIVFT